LNQAMKQRLVGTLVLGCLAIILAPLLLDGNGIQAPPLTATIPAEPKFDNTPIAEPQRPVIVSDKLPASGQEPLTTETSPAKSPLPAFNSKEGEPVPGASKAAQPDALEAAVATVMARDKQSGSVAAKEAVPHLDSSGLPLSYVVRMGSFSERKNADALVAKLVAGGHKAYTRTVNKMIIVYDGPVLTKAEASSLASRLESAYKIKGVVETFSSQASQ
jgi:DedD protein